MAKVSGSYKSLVRGVSQQVPENRLPGQHTEQVNVLPDPVRGLVRRQGSTRLAESVISATSVPETIEDLGKNFWEADVKVEGTNFTLIARRPGTAGAADDLYLLRRGTPSNDGAVVPITASTAAATLLAGGLNGQTVAGQYLLLAHNSPITGTETAVWSGTTNKSRAYIALRGGTYSRRYTVRIKKVGAVEKTVTYETPTSSYQGTLDTSDIPYNAVDYTKRVNDRVNAYNSAVTAWIGTAAAAILPQAIAQSLLNAMNADGWPAYLGGTIVREGAILAMVVGTGVEIEYVKVDDAGAGEQLKALWQEVKDPTDLPAYAHVGQVAKIAPEGKDAYYLVAEGTGTGLSIVTWKEGPATTTSMGSPFLLGVMYSGTLYVGASPSDLQATLPGGSGITVPAIGQRKAGDQDSSPMPHFVGKVVTFIGMFQDRVVIGSQNVINASRIGDYFNFWRMSALTVPDDDTVEVFGNGSEDDVIRHGAFFDRTLVLFGDRQQYAISGKIPLTPATANIAQSSAHKDAARVRPIAHGDSMFYTKTEGDRSTVYQIRVGNTEDTSNSTEVSQQLDDYLRGQGLSLSAVSMPDVLFLRTDADPHTFYAFRYLDNMNGERLVDAWYTFRFHEACGHIVAFSVWQDRLRVIFARDVGTGAALVVDELSMVAGDMTLPHLDSQSPHTGRTMLPSMQCAWGENPVATRSWQGEDDGDIAGLFAELGSDALLRVGFPFDSYVDLTSPVPRDRNDDAILTGRMAVTRLLVNHDRTGAYDVVVNSDYETRTSLRFRGRTVNGLSTLLGQVVLQKGQASAMVGREWREYTARIKSHQWYPFTVTGITWIGQLFNRTPRV